MSHKTIWVYRGASEASEILDDANELALWAKEGYFPKAVEKPAEAPKAESMPLRMDGPTLEEYIKAGYKAETYPPEGYAPKASAPGTTTATSAEQLPEGSQASTAASDVPVTPPDSAGPGSGAPAEAPKAEGKQKKG